MLVVFMMLMVPVLVRVLVRVLAAGVQDIGDGEDSRSVVAMHSRLVHSDWFLQSRGCPVMLSLRARGLRFGTFFLFFVRSIVHCSMLGKKRFSLV